MASLAGAESVKMMMQSNDRPNYMKVKREAAKILQDFGIVNPPVDPVKISREMGLKVHFVQFKDGYDNVSGFYDFRDNAIFVNAAEYPLRQTFTVAHELGHSILHKEWAQSSDYRILMRDSSIDDSNLFEKEANAFAAHLLVPRAFLDKFVERTSPQQLSQLFAVSVPTIKARLAIEYGY